MAIVVPARDEAHNIERCARAVLASDYPALEFIVVDDHSGDGTGDIARRIAANDPRMRVIEPPPLPRGWFGKQWACATAAASSRSEFIGFLDADTWPAPDLVTRTINAMRARSADLLSVLGHHELGSFWEKVIQPQVYSMLAVRYGGTETMERSRYTWDKIANGQCLFVRRHAYEAVGGHESVRDKVAEDLMLAQRFFSAGRRVSAVLGREQLTTRMYTSLREIVRGWRKNVYAGGRDAMPPIPLRRQVYPFLLITPPLMTIAPPVLLALGLAHLVPRGALVWAAITSTIMLVWFAGVYHLMRMPRRYAVLYPLGAVVLLGIMSQAILRGSRVAWKGREYIAN